MIQSAFTPLSDNRGMGTGSDRASCWLGAAVLGVSFALAAALLRQIPPSQLAVVVAGLTVTSLCGLALLVRGLRRWASAIVLATACALLAGGALTVRASSDELQGLPLSLRTDEARCAVHLQGDLPPTLYRRMRDALDAHPGIRAVVLNSAGGSALAVEDVAQLLRERHVDTAAAYGQCDSACAFLWVSAPQRFVVGADRRLSVGFHAPHVRVPGWGAVRASLQDNRQRQSLRELGLPEPFIGWAYAPLETTWRPDVDQLTRIGVPARFLGAARIEDLSFCSTPPQTLSKPSARRRAHLS